MICEVVLIFYNIFDVINTIWERIQVLDCLPVALPQGEGLEVCTGAVLIHPVIQNVFLFDSKL